MFEQEIKLNQFTMTSFNQVVADIPKDRMNERAAGNGHPPFDVGDSNQNDRVDAGVWTGIIGHR